MIRPGFGTHIPLLIKALLLTKGNVVEFGCGYFSTPILHGICNYTGRQLTSYETLPKFFMEFEPYNFGMHKVKLIEDWEGLDLGHCSLAFVDCKPASARKEIIRRLKDKAEMIVVHDTQKKKKAMTAYNYESIYPLFKYQHHCDKTNTSVLSNMRNIEQAFQERVFFITETDQEKELLRLQHVEIKNKNYSDLIDHYEKELKTCQENLERTNR